jgi:hypothetical protein
MIMKTSTSSLSKLAQAIFLMLFLSTSLNFTAFGQISLNEETGEANPKSRKLKREAARYKAEAVKESHLDMKNFSYKKGQPGKREEGELAYDEIYNAPSPVKEERIRFFKRKK